ncbi:MAG: FHA domain-containing protein [Chloroherpetonaceae bacterium]|nr:FHA domain-containing protein [Chloroherpetonaceae bacterium]
MYASHRTRNPSIVFPGRAVFHRIIPFTFCIAMMLQPAGAQTSGVIFLHQAEDVPDGLKYRLVSSTTGTGSWRPVPGRLDRWLRLEAGSAALAKGAQLQILSEEWNRIARVALDPLRARAATLRATDAQDRSNLLPNGDFRNGTENWRLIAPAISAGLEVRGGVARVTVNRPGTDNLRLVAGGLMLKAGLPYVLRFRARASAPRTIVVTTLLDTLTADPVGLRREEKLTPRWQDFTYRFVATEPTTDLKGTRPVVFQWPSARPAGKVVVAGSFNGWEGDRTPMTFDGRGWRATVNLPPGNHQYKFIVDGRWENDPSAPLIDDGDGHMNNLLRVPYPARLVVMADGTPGAIEIAGVTVRPDYRATTPEMRATLTRDQFRTYATVQVPVTYQGRAAYGVNVTLGTPDRVIATVALDAHHNGVATFEEVPTDVPLQVRLARAQESVQFADRRVEEPDGLISGVAVPDSWTGVPTLAGVPQVRTRYGARQAMVPVVVVPPASTANDRLTYLLAGVLAVGVLLLAGAIWVLEMRRRAPQTTSGNGGSVAGNNVRAVVGRAPSPSLLGVGRPNARPLPETGDTNVTGGAVPTASRLVGVYGVYAGYTFSLAPDRTEIGREISRGVALPQDGNVSRKHAVIQYLDGEYVLRDEGSSNGTYVNGVRIPVDVPYPIKPGDEIQFGASRFRFEA